MTKFKIYSKNKNRSRFTHRFTTTDPKRAELVALNECEFLCMSNVKVIAIDDNGVTNEIIYK